LGWTFEAVTALLQMVQVFWDVTLSPCLTLKV